MLTQSILHNRARSDAVGVSPNWARRKIATGRNVHVASAPRVRPTASVPGEIYLVRSWSNLEWRFFDPNRFMDEEIFWTDPPADDALRAAGGS